MRFLKEIERMVDVLTPKVVEIKEAVMFVGQQNPASFHVSTKANITFLNDCEV